MADVGRLAGVSATTVSFVVNDQRDQTISEATRARVLAAVAELGYRPNRAARQLRTRRAATVGFVTDQIAVDPFAGPAISGAHDVAWEHGSLLLVVNTMLRREVFAAAVDDLHDRDVDAILYAVVGTRRVTVPESMRALPAVLVNCFVAGDTLPCVLPDDVGGGRAATEHVLAHGHREVAYVAGHASGWATRARTRGFGQALRAAGLDPRAQTVVHGDYSVDSGYERTRELLAGRRLPTAIMYGNDRMALGAYLALAEAGLRIPDDVSVVGYDDQAMIAPEIHPRLSTVRLPYYDLGRWAATQLFSGDLSGLPGRTFLPCPLIARESVGPPRTSRASST
jgi:LacI family transcriptional regulator